MLSHTALPEHTLLAVPRRPFEDLPSHLLPAILATESPRLVATILANLPDEQARWLFGEVAAARADAVVACWAAGDMITDADGIREAEAALLQRILERPMASVTSGGPDLAAHLLCMLPRADRDERLTALARADPHSATAVRDRILEFEDLALLTHDDMRRLLDRIDPTDLADALRTETALVQGAFVDRLGATRAMVVRRLLLEPVRYDRGPWARRRILDEAAGLIDAGRIGWPLPVGA